MKPSGLVYKKFRGICAVLFATALLNTCENPYITHNLKRPVYMEAMAFRTDKDEPNAASYPLSPIFNSQVKNYTVVVHELAEKVYPTGIPEAGASVVFGESRYTQGDVEKTAVQDGGGYNFPSNVSEMVIEFTVVKNYRHETGYTVRVLRRPPPGMLRNLRVTVAYWNSTGVPSENPNDPKWVYETDNYIRGGFNSLTQDYSLKVPYYAQKILIEPDTDADIVISYHLYRQNPQFSTPLAVIDYPDSARPQYFDYSVEATDPDYLSKGSNPETYYKYVNPQLRICPPEKVNDSKTSYIYMKSKTADGLFPTEYRLKIQWDKPYAYLSDLDVRDDSAPSDKRLKGTFSMTNPDYDAETAASAAAVTVYGKVRGPDSIGKVVCEQSAVGVLPVKFPYRGLVTTAATSDSALKALYPDAVTGDWIHHNDGITDVTWTFDGTNWNNDGPPGEAKLESRKAFTVTLPFPGTMESALLIFKVEDTTLGDPVNGEYRITVTRGEQPTYMRNLKIEGWAPNPEGSSNYEWQTLYWYDKDDDGNGTLTPEIYNSASYPKITLKDPAAFNPHPGDFDPTNYTLEIEGAVTRLRFTGYPEDNSGKVQYNWGDNSLYYDVPIDFEFSGGTSIRLKATKPGKQLRTYSFTIMRAGAMAIELLTDMRDPFDAGYGSNPVIPVDRDK
ncbi:MAG: hypothetical protein LBB83_01900, partial [Treponema sp.]|nr:hypothetical protein [Treponema sp.]